MIGKEIDSLIEALQALSDKRKKINGFLTELGFEIPSNSDSISTQQLYDIFNDPDKRKQLISKLKLIAFL